MLSGSITAVAVAAMLFAGLHFAMSGPLRGPMRRLFGPGYPGVYSLVVAIPFAWLLWAYAGAPYVELWSELTWARHLQLPLTLVATIFMVLGLLSPNPTLTGTGDKVLQRMDTPRGITAITRHPFNLGVAVWASGHILANGDAASLWLFGSLLALGLGGALHIDARHRKAGDPDWIALERQTSLVPFAAVVSGRAKLRFSGADWVRLGAAVLCWAILLFLHEPLIGRSPFPV